MAVLFCIVNFYIKAKILTHYNIYYAKILTNESLKMHTVYTAILFNLNFIDIMVTSLSMKFTSSQIQSIGRNGGYKKP